MLIRLDLAAILALQALGRELDRRERVLDLMRDAARDVGPGGIALGGDEIGDVVEGQHVAVGVVLGAFRGDAGKEAAGFSGALDIHLAFRESGRAAEGLLEDRHEG